MRAIKKRAHRNMVEVEAKQRWNWRLMAWARSILTLPGVEGKSSSSKLRISSCRGRGGVMTQEVSYLPPPVGS